MLIHVCINYMFSQQKVSMLLILFVAVLSYQTVALAVMTKKFQDAQVGFGRSPSAVNFTDDGSSPNMVGGC